VDSVIGQSPAAAAKARKGSQVTLTLSKGPKPPPPPSAPVKAEVTWGPASEVGDGAIERSVTVSMPKNGGEAGVELKWAEGGTGSIGGASIKPGADFKQKVRGKPGWKVQVLINGKSEKEFTF
jgi:beta-lactam-binding protein with PASTA domain